MLSKSKCDVRPPDGLYCHIDHSLVYENASTRDQDNPACQLVFANREASLRFVYALDLHSQSRPDREDSLFGRARQMHHTRCTERQLNVERNEQRLTMTWGQA